MEDYIGDYYRGYSGGYAEFRQWLICVVATTFGHVLLDCRIARLRFASLMTAALSFIFRP